MSRIAIFFTGGTIASGYDEQAQGVVALHGAEAILSRVKGLERVADLDVHDWGMVPASHMTFAQIFEIAARLQQALDRDDVTGAVLVQGTDNIEETSFAYDLLVQSEKPIVIVGAMRNTDEDGYEGARNLRFAIAAAADPCLRGQGVVVAMAGELHGADDVMKTHTLSYSTFKSPNFGPLGHVDDAGVVLARSGRRRRHIPAVEAAEPVMLVTTTLGGDDTLIHAADEAGCKGLVIEAAGAGNTPSSMLEACEPLFERGIPVVIASRCPSGPSRPIYAFPGAGLTWLRAGAIFSGFLPGLKARIMLSFAVGAGFDDAALRELYAD